jgi:hypothetical protein
VVEHGAAAAEAISYSHGRIRRLVASLCLRVMRAENEGVKGNKNSTRLLPASQYAGFLLYWFKAKGQFVAHYSLLYFPNIVQQHQC